MRQVLALFLLVLAVGCTKSSDKSGPMPPPKDTTQIPVDSTDTTDTVSAPIDSFITYIVPAGANYVTGNTYPPFSGTVLHFRAILDSSCIYQTADTNNQADINKLYGFADCNSFHHKNSARFGWSWYKDTMRIHAYCYVDSVRQYIELGAVSVSKPFECKLEVIPGKYLFTLNGKTDTMLRGCQSTAAAGYKLLPYFGGDEPAPHEIRVKIQEIP